MKVLVAGCGSIGARHIKNLLGLEEIEEILLFTSRPDCSKIFDDRQRKIKVIDNLDGIKADFAIIANHTHKHLETAVLLAKKGLNLFIEKPVSHNLKGLNRLIAIAKRKDLKLSVGYNLRFLNAIKFLRKLIMDNAIGPLYFSRIEAGQYLPQWRKNIDYRNSYSAHRRQGGGVALDLSHEVDYMRYLFGDPQRWKVTKAKVSNLEIDSDDIFEGVYVYKNDFVCSVHLDYLQNTKTRKITIVGEKGSICCDLCKKEIVIKKENKEAVTINDELYFNLDETYVAELKYFLNVIQQERKPQVTLRDGVMALKLLEDGHV